MRRKRREEPGEAGAEVLAARIHGLPVKLWVLHHCAAPHILRATQQSLTSQTQAQDAASPTHAHQAILIRIPFIHPFIHSFIQHYLYMLTTNGSATHHGL